MLLSPLFGAASGSDGRDLRAMPKKGGGKKAPKKAAAAKAGKSDEQKKKDDDLMAKAKAMREEADQKRAEERAKQAAEDAEKYASYGLSESDIREFREMFTLVDTDGGGSIGKEEVLDLMRMVGYDCTEDEVEDMINEIDQDGNMEIDFDEFITMMSRKPDALKDPEEIKAAFKLFETAIDGKPGHVRQSTLLHALTNLSSEKLSRSEAVELLAQIPADDRDMVNYADYITMMAQ